MSEEQIQKLIDKINSETEALKKHPSKTKAKGYLVKAGLIDKDGNATPPYRS